MKLARLGLATGLALATMAGSVVAAAPASAAKATRTSVVRPVTASGHAAKGWRVVKDTRRAIDCRAHSPHAVDNGIAICGSTADNTLACWKQAGKHRVLCLSDPFRKTLRSIKLSGKFRSVVAQRNPNPLALTLHSGNKFLARDGGAWAKVRQHPSWVGYYIQRSTGRHAIYGPTGGDGINQSRARWSVQVYRSSRAPADKRLVDRAWYVGTKH